MRTGSASVLQFRKIMLMTFNLDLDPGPIFIFSVQSSTWRHISLHQQSSPLLYCISVSAHLKDDCLTVCAVIASKLETTKGNFMYNKLPLYQVRPFQTYKPSSHFVLMLFQTDGNLILFTQVPHI